MMILASAVLAGSLLATDAQARRRRRRRWAWWWWRRSHGRRFLVEATWAAALAEAISAVFGGGPHRRSGAAITWQAMRGEHFGGGRRHFARGGLYDDGLGLPLLPDIHPALHPATTEWRVDTKAALARGFRDPARLASELASETSAHLGNLANPDAAPCGIRLDSTNRISRLNSNLRSLNANLNGSPPRGGYHFVVRLSFARQARSTTKEPI